MICGLNITKITNPPPPTLTLSSCQVPSPSTLAPNLRPNPNCLLAFAKPRSTHGRAQKATPCDPPWPQVTSDNSRFFSRFPVGLPPQETPCDPRGLRVGFFSLSSLLPADHLRCLHTGGGWRGCFPRPPPTLSPPALVRTLCPPVRPPPQRAPQCSTSATPDPCRPGSGGWQRGLRCAAAMGSYQDPWSRTTCAHGGMLDVFVKIQWATIALCYNIFNSSI